MLGAVKSITVRLPDDVGLRLRHEARRRGVSVSTLIRMAIDSQLGGRRRLVAAAAGRSGRADDSERIEELLSAEVRR
jgi:predicted transcriptional regulator